MPWPDHAAGAALDEKVPGAASQTTGGLTRPGIAEALRH